MKLKQIIISSIIFIGVYLLAQMPVNLHFSNSVKLPGGKHRVVVVINPVSVNGGVIVINKSFDIEGSSTTIYASINCEITE
jgi:hypothetical protein